MVSREQMRCALDKRQGAELSGILSSSCAAVCGLGGLGSNAALCLARSGVGELILVDFDRVDVSNLHRQQYRADQPGMLKTEALRQNILEAAPYTQIRTYAVRLDEKNACEILEHADVVIEAFDDAECKAMLVNTVLEKLPEKYIVAASGMAGLLSANSIVTRRISERLYLCGDGVSEVNDREALFASRVMLCAAHQAHMAIKLLSGDTGV